MIFLSLIVKFLNTCCSVSKIWCHFMSFKLHLFSTQYSENHFYRSNIKMEKRLCRQYAGMRVIVSEKLYAGVWWKKSDRSKTGKFHGRLLATCLGRELYLLRHTFFWPSNYSFLAVNSYTLIKEVLVIFRIVV